MQRVTNSIMYAFELENYHAMLTFVRNVTIIPRGKGQGKCLYDQENNQQLRHCNAFGSETKNSNK